MIISSKNYFGLGLPPNSRQTKSSMFSDKSEKVSLGKKLLILETNQVQKDFFHVFHGRCRTICLNLLNKFRKLELKSIFLSTLDLEGKN